MDLFLALSVHRFVTSVGSYAGFASIVGLAILILLFFAQARETNALRDHVDELLERIAGLESRVARQAQAQAAAEAEADRVAAASAAPARPALAAVGGTGSANFALPPAPPAGVGAPALAAATRVIPLAIPAGAAAAGARASGSGSGSGGVATAPPPATPAATNGSSRAAVPSPNGPAALGREPGGTPRPVTPAPVRASAATAAGATRRPAAASTIPPRDRVPSPGTGRYPRGRIVLVIGLLIAVAAAAVAVVLVTSSSSKKTPAPAHQTTRRASSSTAPVNPRTVTVATLNGTGTAGLAHRIAQRLKTSGFQTTNPTTAPDQTRTSTTVAYIPGARTQALAVAQALKLGPASVAPVDQGTRVVGCGGSPTCPASVFVTVGSDLAGQ